MTPALPALDALLKDVEGASKWMTHATDNFNRTAAPRLAAMLRVAVERIVVLRAAVEDARELARTMRDQYADGRDTAKYDEWDESAVGFRVEVDHADAALARIEAMAKGEA